MNGSNEVVTPKRWGETLTYMIGGRYRLNDRAQLLAGYIRGHDPIPDDTFEPTVTDSTHSMLTGGAEFKLHRHKLALAYGFQDLQDRNKNNSVGAASSVGTVTDARANGKYESRSHFLAASFTYVF